MNTLEDSFTGMDITTQYTTLQVLLTTKGTEPYIQAELARLRKENEEKLIQEARDGAAKCTPNDAYIHNQKPIEEIIVLDETRKSRIRKEAAQCLIDSGMPALDADFCIKLIELNEVKHVSINF